MTQACEAVCFPPIQASIDTFPALAIMDDGPQGLEARRYRPTRHSDPQDLIRMGLAKDADLNVGQRLTILHGEHTRRSTWCALLALASEQKAQRQTSDPYRSMHFQSPSTIERMAL